jgi:hypothetical protein
MATVTRTNDIEKVAQVMAAAFTSSALTAYVLRSPNSTWRVENIPAEVIGPHMLAGTAKKAALGAELVEAGNWAAAAIWFDPF